MSEPIYNPDNEVTGQVEVRKTKHLKCLSFEPKASFEPILDRFLNSYIEISAGQGENLSCGYFRIKIIHIKLLATSLD